MKEESGKSEAYLRAQLLAAIEQRQIDEISNIITPDFNLNFAIANCSPLERAVFYEDEEIVNLLINKGADVNYLEKADTTPLQQAAGKGLIAMATLLLEKGALVDKGNNVDWTPFYFACRNGHLEMAKLLISHGANINHVTKRGATSLLAAAFYGHLEMVDFLLSYEVETEQCDSVGDTALSAACEAGHIEVVKLLISKGANIFFKKEGKLSLLYLAAKKNNQEMAELLISKGVPISEKGNDFNDPLYRSMCNGHDAMARLLIAKGANLAVIDRSNFFDKKVQDIVEERKKATTSFLEKIENNDVNTISDLIKSGFDVNFEIDKSSPLERAVFYGHEQIVELLVSRGADVNYVTKDDWTPLQRAASNGSVSIATFLINHGALVDQGNKNSDWTPFYFACRNGHIETAKLLKARGANIHHVTKKGVTVLLAAAFYGHLEMVDLLLSYEVEVEKCDSVGDTALSAACEAGHIEVVKLLVSKGANILFKKEGKQSLLYLAAREGRQEIVEFLIAEGIPLNEEGVDFSDELYCTFNPLYRSMCNGQEAIARLLVAKGANLAVFDNRSLHSFPENVRDIVETRHKETSSMFQAIEHDNINNVLELIKSGLNVNFEIDKTTPLERAVFYGREKIVELLVSNGADVNYATKGDWTPLQRAADQGLESIAIFLINNGALIDKGDTYDWTPFYLACRKGHVAMAKLLISHGANINHVSNTGVTSLISAAFYGHFEMVKFLAENSEDINEVDNYGENALYSGCLSGNLMIVEELLSRGSDVLHCSNNGKTMMHAAVEGGNSEIIKLLVSKGVSISSKDKNSKPPIYSALLNGNESIVELLIENGADHYVCKDDEIDKINIMTRGLASKNSRAIMEKKYEIIGSPYNFLSRLRNGDLFDSRNGLSYYSDSQEDFAYLSLHCLLKCNIEPKSIFDFSNDDISLEEIAELEKLYKYISDSRLNISEITQPKFAPFFHQEDLRKKTLYRHYLETVEEVAVVGDRSREKKDDYFDFFRKTRYRSSYTQSSTHTLLTSGRYYKYRHQRDKSLYLSEITKMLDCFESEDDKILLGQYSGYNNKHQMGCYRENKNCTAIDRVDDDEILLGEYSSYNNKHQMGRYRENKNYTAIDRVDAVTALAAKKALSSQLQDEALKYAFLFGLLRGYNLRSFCGACWAQEMSLRWIFLEKQWEQFRKAPGIFLDLAATSSEYSSIEQLIELQITSYKNSIANNDQTKKVHYEEFFTPPVREQSDFKYYLLLTYNMINKEDLKELIFYQKDRETSFHKAASMRNYGFFEDLKILFEQDQELLLKAQAEVFDKINWYSVQRKAEIFKDEKFTQLIKSFKEEIILKKIPQKNAEEVIISDEEQLPQPPRTNGAAAATVEKRTAEESVLQDELKRRKQSGASQEISSLNS